MKAIIGKGSAGFVDKPMGSVNDDDVVQIHGPICYGISKGAMETVEEDTLEIKDRFDCNIYSSNSTER